MYETLLVPTDGSDRAAVAASHAIDIAAARSATVHVLPVETTTDTGHPAECIVDYAVDHDIDINVVESVSQRVVRESPAPVPTVGTDVEGRPGSATT